MRFRSFCLALRMTPPVIPLLIVFAALVGVYLTDRTDPMISEMVRAVFYAVLTMTGIGPASRHIQRVSGPASEEGADEPAK